MLFLTPHARIAAALVACSAAIGQAQAQTAVQPAATTTGEGAANAFGAATAVDAASLEQVTGREDTGAMIASATQRNTVSNNSVTGTSTTGTITIDGNAFQNLQGLAVISANSGNNVAMNAAMNVTVNLAPR